MSIDIPFNKIAPFCIKWQVCEFSLFGSVLRDDFNATSDIDVLVSFSKDAHPTLFTLARIRNELIQIFGREVDLVTKRGMEMSRNYIRKKDIRFSKNNLCCVIKNTLQKSTIKGRFYPKTNLRYNNI